MVALKKIDEKGFTLVELLVAISIFTLIMTVSMGSILSILDANKKSNNLRSVMDNVGVTLEGMSRTIRFGHTYHCGASGSPTIPQNCGGDGNNNITVTSSSGTLVTYKLTSGRIIRTVCPVSGACGADLFVTSPDTTITTLTFRVFGADPYNSGTDLLQPQVIMTVAGYVGTKNSSKSSFVLETTVSQRQFDF